MTAFGYTMMCEQSRPDQLVRDVRSAEAAGFDFAVISDHYQPWVKAQGHFGYAWSILGAAAGDRPDSADDLCHVPDAALSAGSCRKKAATMQILSGGRFRLELGSGENLEHVVGRRWPAAGVRHHMLGEA